MDPPEDKGTYVLIASVSQMKRIEIGRLGRFNIIPGYYAYVGSAFGPGGLRARLGHHLESTADPHWHIDYLLQVAHPVEIWYTTADRKLEPHWADLLKKASQFRIPIPRFGSSDYHRSRSSHLFYSKRRPAFGWFHQLLAEQFEEACAERYVVARDSLEAQKPKDGSISFGRRSMLVRRRWAVVPQKYRFYDPHVGAIGGRDHGQTKL